ncbi:MAG: hypothetical protein FWE79_02505, partial [Firmicutes bacterium]|nr:hypothetical protein [Bacillota bacterium]
DLLLTYTAMLDSYSRLFVEQMRTATFWHLHRAGGSNVFHATHELSGATANPVLVLGEEIRNITTDQFNDLSLAANFGNIRGDYFAMKARVEIFATLIEPFNNAVRIFNFAGLREEVIRNFGPSGYTLNNVRGYLGARALSEEEQRTVRTASVEDQNRYEFVQRVLFDDFEHNMFAPMTAYLARIADLT